MISGTVIKKYKELGIRSIMINGNDTMFVYIDDWYLFKDWCDFPFMVISTEKNWNMNSITNNPWSIQIEDPETKLKLFDRKLRKLKIKRIKNEEI